jgi:DNA-binding NarL/FixJ family response regulator
VILHITPEERMALQLLAEGTTTEGLAVHLGTSECEAGAYLTTLFAKLGAGCRAEALAAAARRGLLAATDIQRQPLHISPAPSAESAR